MSTRQLRLITREQIRERLKTFRSKKVSLVMNDQTVQFVTVEKADDTSVIVTNMRLKTLTIPLNDISEIYFDTIE